jgi:NAD(P)-dependent dehydrogenase (short-subunit alcohol dehydrogenase family)
MKTILITGANRGIGLGFVKEYAKAGWRVLAACRHPKQAEELNVLATMRPYQTITVFELDIGDEASIKKLAQELAQETIDVLLNNAGVLVGVNNDKFGKQLGRLQQADLIESFKINSIGPLLLTQALVEPLARASNSKVININSGLGSIADNVEGGMYGYRASKSALNAFTKNLALELREKNIIVISLAPGWVKTDMGGQNAELTVEESVSKMQALISELGMVDTGKFFDYTGDEREW